jgi:histidine triad (HIT) family protein
MLLQYAIVKDMFNHEPRDYACPFCNFLAGNYNDRNAPEDIVYKNEHVLAFIAPQTWPNNKGHVIVVPTGHFENIYDIPDQALGAVYRAVKKISIAIRETYGCNGVSSRQHNEPDGGQDVWHFHVHIFPRYPDDNLYETARISINAAERAPYAKKLRAYFDTHSG